MGGCGERLPTSACAKRRLKLLPRPVSAAPNSIGAGWLSGTRRDEAGATCRHAPPATRAAPGANGGMALPLAFAAARVAHRCARVALPFRRDRHPGPPRRRARGNRSEITEAIRHRCICAGAAAAATDYPRRRSLPVVEARSRSARPPIRSDAGRAVPAAAPLAERLASRYLRLTHPTPCLIGSAARLSDNNPGETSTGGFWLCADYMASFVQS